MKKCDEVFNGSAGQLLWFELYTNNNDYQSLFPSNLLGFYNGLKNMEIKFGFGFNGKDCAFQFWENEIEV